MHRRLATEAGSMKLGAITATSREGTVAVWKRPRRGGGCRGRAAARGGVPARWRSNGVGAAPAEHAEAKRARDGRSRARAASGLGRPSSVGSRLLQRGTAASRPCKARLAGVWACEARPREGRAVALGLGQSGAELGSPAVASGNWACRRLSGEGREHEEVRGCEAGSGAAHRRCAEGLRAGKLAIGRSSGAARALRSRELGGVRARGWVGAQEAAPARMDGGWAWIHGGERGEREGENFLEGEGVLAG